MSGAAEKIRKGEEEAAEDPLLADRLFEQLCEAIAMGVHAPGEKLSEPRLAARYGASRASLREAIRRLEGRKLVTRAPRQGVRVISPTPEDAAELFAIREALEGMAARLAAERATAEEVAALREMLARHREVLSEPEALARWQASANSDFHFMVARIGGNKQLFDLLCGEYYTLFRVYRMRRRLEPGRMRRALVEHERIVEAIAEGDAELAELLMRRHVVAARRGDEF